MRIKLAAPRLSLLACGPFTALARPAHPDDGRRITNPETRCRLPRRGSRQGRIDHTVTQILTVSSGHVPPPSLSRQRTRTVRLIWESHSNLENDERALELRDPKPGPITPLPAVEGTHGDMVARPHLGACNECHLIELARKHLYHVAGSLHGTVDLEVRRGIPQLITGDGVAIRIAGGEGSADTSESAVSVWCQKLPLQAHGVAPAKRDRRPRPDT